VGGAEETAGERRYRSFAHRVDIDVSVERVWRAFTDGRLLARWAAAEATIAPRKKAACTWCSAPTWSSTPTSTC
jgi:uncharacterized protein YndB with AHSA1/START domain